MDAANADTSYGGVLETHEISGGVYNNVYGPLMVAAAVEGQVWPLAGDRDIVPGGLPSRP